MWKPDSKQEAPIPVASTIVCRLHMSSIAIGYAVCALARLNPLSTELALTLGQPMHRRNIEVAAVWLTERVGTVTLATPEALSSAPAFTVLFGEYLRARRH